MSDGDIPLDTARERAEAARVELREALDDAMGWLSPGRLKAEVAEAASHQIDEVKTALRQSVTRHPMIAWPALALITAALTYLLRRPVAAAARTGTRTACALYQRFFGRK